MGEQARPAVLRVALTGGIGSGKTAVSDLLAELGAVVIDSDVLAREVVAPGTAGLAQVVEEFGDEVLAEDGSLDRAALAREVFADDQARRRLESIIHPLVRARAAEIERTAPAGSVVVHVIPLLVETGQQGKFDRVLVVDVPESLQVERLTARGVTVEDATARIRAQASRADRLAAADVVIDNSGTPDDLAYRVRQLWADLRNRAEAATLED